MQRTSVLAAACAFIGLAPAYPAAQRAVLQLPPPPDLIASADGGTVYDTKLNVRWLANANIAHSPAGQAIAAQAGITDIRPGGSMTWQTAAAFVDALNNFVPDNTLPIAPGAAPGYLGHHDWTVPTTPSFGAEDAGCSSHGSAGSGFGYGCTESDFGSLFTSLGIKWPNTAVPVHDISVGPFRDFQPYLYWSNDEGHTFSFNTGWAGSNTAFHYMYVLPMIEGKVRSAFGVRLHYTRTGIGSLEVSDDGELVWDPDAPYQDDLGNYHYGVTWLANADLAKSEKFDVQCHSYKPSDHATHFPNGIPCIDRADGSMANDTAHHFVDAMNAAAWLGQTNWQLPPRPGGCEDIGCVNTPMGHLYQTEFGLSIGTPVVSPRNERVGPFRHLQPYLYWSCAAAPVRTKCADLGPVDNQEWSFSFGNGMQDTDILGNSLYLMVYFPQSVEQAIKEAIRKDLDGNPLLGTFLGEVDAIVATTNSTTKTILIGQFIERVTAARGTKDLTLRQANELTSLALAL